MAYLTKGKTQHTCLFIAMISFLGEFPGAWGKQNLPDDQIESSFPGSSSSQSTFTNKPPSISLSAEEEEEEDDEEGSSYFEEESDKEEEEEDSDDTEDIFGAGARFLEKNPKLVDGLENVASPLLKMIFDYDLPEGSFSNLSKSAQEVLKTASTVSTILSRFFDSFLKKF